MDMVNTDTDIAGGEGSDTAEPLVQVRLLASERRYGWVRERALRLLPAVEAFVREDYALPEPIVVHLATRAGMVREIGWARAREESLNPTMGAVMREMLDAVPDKDVAAAAPIAAPVQVFINIGSAPARAETELGARLARGLTLAALYAEPGRARVLRASPMFRVRSRLADDRLFELGLARLEAEEAAARCAAESWRHRNTGTRPLAKRARQVLEVLAAGVIEADQPHANRVAAGPAAWAEATIRRVYDASAPDGADLGLTGLAGLKTLINQYGTEAGVDGESVEADRHRRLCAAAWCDFMALIGTQRTGDENGAWHDDAILLGWHLRDFDAQHGTSRGEVPAGNLEWESSGRSRHYTRQEWLATTHRDPAEPER